MFDGGERKAAMPLSLEERAAEERSAQYRERAVELRQLAGRSRYEENRRQLRGLAEQFDALAASLEHVTFAA